MIQTSQVAHIIALYSSTWTALSFKISYLCTWWHFSHWFLFDLCFSKPATGSVRSMAVFFYAGAPEIQGNFALHFATLAKADGIEIFFIGTRDSVPRAQMEALAYDEDHVMYMSDPDTVPSLVNDLLHPCGRWTNSKLFNHHTQVI